MRKSIIITIALCALLSAMFISVVIFNRHYRDRFSLPTISMDKFKSKGSPTNNLTVQTVSNVGRYVVSFDMTIPCSNKSQQAALKRKLPRIKSDFLIYLNNSDMEEYVRERNFVNIKANLLHVVNMHTDKPVQQIYLTKFNYY